MTAPGGPPEPPAGTCPLAPVRRRSGGPLPAPSPPDPGLAQHPAGRLPFPSDAAGLVAPGDRHGRDLREGSAFGPPPEPAVDGGPSGAGREAVREGADGQRRGAGGGADQEGEVPRRLKLHDLTEEVVRS